jgi:hypothetical protein
MEMLSMRAILVSAAIVVLSGCAVSQGALKNFSAGKIGCTPDKISVSNYSESDEIYSWVAECQSKKFVCSKQRGEAATLSCSEAMP